MCSVEIPLDFDATVVIQPEVILLDVYDARDVLIDAIGEPADVHA